MKIAFLGTGLMGAPMVRCLLGAGYSVDIWNRTAEKACMLVADGACAHEKIGNAVAGSDFVITMLSGAPALEEVLFAPGNVADSMKRDALAIDMSSLAPKLAFAQHETFAKRHIAHLDAPVSGGVEGAKNGKLSIMAGGSKSDFARAAPIFSAMGNAFHLGKAGAGQICKMVNQIIVHVTIGAVTEGLLFSSAMGVDAGKVREAISGGFCQSRILELHGGRMIDRDFVPGGPLKFSVKDLGGALAHAKDIGFNLPLAGQVLERYRQLAANGLGGLDHSALLKAYEMENEPHRVSPGKQDILP